MILGIILTNRIIYFRFNKINNTMFAITKKNFEKPTRSLKLNQTENIDTQFVYEIVFVISV